MFNYKPIGITSFESKSHGLGWQTCCLIYPAHGLDRHSANGSVTHAIGGFQVAQQPLTGRQRR